MLVHTNLTLSGSVAQYGRGVGIIQATAAQIMNQFAKCLRDKFGQQRVAGAAAGARHRVTPMPPRARAVAGRPAAAARQPGQADLGLLADGARDLELDHRPVPALVGVATRWLSY